MFAALNVSEKVTALDAEEHTRELQVRCYGFMVRVMAVWVVVTNSSDRSRKGSRCSSKR